MKVILIRHGETTWDLEDRYGWLYNDHLTKSWEEQCQKLANDIFEYSISTVYSSPLLRAQQTAGILAKSKTISLSIVDDLREKNHYSFLSWLTKSEAKNYYPKLVDSLNSYDSQLPGAESYSDFVIRVKDVFKIIVASHWDAETIAIVSHGWWIRCFLREILKAWEYWKIWDCWYLVLERNTTDINILEKYQIEQ